jgi:hypothetical protein
VRTGREVPQKAGDTIECFLPLLERHPSASVFLWFVRVMFSHPAFTAMSCRKNLSGIGSDLGPISRPKSPLEFPLWVKNGLSVPFSSNQLHRPATLSRQRAQVGTSPRQVSNPNSWNRIDRPTSIPSIPRSAQLGLINDGSPAARLHLRTNRHLQTACRNGGASLIFIFRKWRRPKPTLRAKSASPGRSDHAKSR